MHFLRDKARLTSQGHFFYLLISLILLLVFYPYVEGEVIGAFSLSMLSSAILISGVYGVSDSRRHCITALCLGVPTLIRHWQELIGIPLLPEKTGLLFPLAFYIFTIFILLSRILRDETVTVDTLYGAACVYLLMGLTWLTAFQLLEKMHPGSFRIGLFQPETVPIEWSDLLFFSYVTLTTLGYGDITPVTSPAKSLAILEAMTGTLYVAFLVARLVGLHRRV